MKSKLVIASLIIAAGAILRFLPHPHNMTPIASMALLGGAYIGRKYLAFLVPLICLFVSDIVLNNTVNRVFFDNAEGFILFRDYMLVTYLAFALTVVLGSVIKNLKGFKMIIGGAILSSLLFFIVTNFGSWMTGHMYPKTIGGLFSCYVAAIPFFWNTIIGNLVYLSLFVTAYEFAVKYYTARAVVTEI